MEFLQQVDLLFLATIVVRPVWLGLTSVAQLGRVCGAGVRPLAPFAARWCLLAVSSHSSVTRAFTHLFQRFQCLHVEFLFVK